jgi:REP element-mobilizing transposase RayT
MSPSIRSRGYLPHLESEHPVYFVTFRLADSLPRELLTRLRKNRRLLETTRQAGAARAPDHVRMEASRALLRKAEHHLDSGAGQFLLRDPRIAQVVADGIRLFDGKRYQVLAWCVMPNHVHVVFAPLAAHRLPEILHSWKSYSSHAANRLLGRSGRFWQPEYFDHLVRNEESLARIIRYVKQNPLKAGLNNWPWVGGRLS